MNEELETKKCPYCRYLIPQDRILCAHCGTISPTLWEKRITDDWESECISRWGNIDRCAEMMFVNNTHHHDYQDYNKYTSLFNTAEKVDKLFLSKISLETHQKDIDILFDKFIGFELISDGYYSHSQRYEIRTKVGGKWFVFDIVGLYRFIGHEDDTVTIFEISHVLHETIQSVIATKKENERQRRIESDKKYQERKKKSLEDRREEEKVQYKKDLEEYNILPWWKRIFKSYPEPKNPKRRLDD